MKMKLNSLLIGLLAVLLCAGTALASEVYTEGFFYYTVENESITITGYFGDETVVTVPNSIAGIPVNAVAEGAFAGTGVKKVILPDTVMEVGEAGSDEVEMYFEGNDGSAPGTNQTDDASAQDNASQEAGSSQTDEQQPGDGAQAGSQAEDGNNGDAGSNGEQTDSANQGTEITVDDDVLEESMKSNAANQAGGDTAHADAPAADAAAPDADHPDAGHTEPDEDSTDTETDVKDAQDSAANQTQERADTAVSEDAAGKSASDSASNTGIFAALIVAAVLAGVVIYRRKRK